EDLHDASDQVDGPLTNRGHGTGTLGILAGRDPADPTRTIGGAPFVEIVPIRVADRVVLFSNSAIARALDYVFSLKDDPEKRIDIVTMSM
ncbi:S8 family serine peptidase, partial [Acinetobacter baumannii]